MKNAIVAAVVAALVASGATLAATSRINGRMIRPHSIPANRLTAAAVTSLIAVPSLVTASGTIPNAPAGTVGTPTAITAQCPAGSVAIAGGYRLTNPANNPAYILQSDGVTQDGTGWQIDVLQGTPGNPLDAPSFTVMAACEAAA